MGRIILHGAVIVMLTVLTQLCGIAWALSLTVRRWRVPVFLGAFLVLWVAAQALAPLAGRVALPCTGDTLRMQSPLYCATLRNFVTPELASVAEEAALRVADAYPGTVTLALDGGFPFLDGMPLLPHLSHDDGEKLDFAFFYTDPAGTYLPGVTRSPVGYWAFETDGASDCPPVRLTMRWGMGWLQPLFPDRPFDPGRTAALTEALLDDPRVAKVFLEPPLATRLGLDSDKLRFQGCRAARHDDHIHVQL
jgi:hypothetical protein